jgi:hypothetical protein
MVPGAFSCFENFSKALLVGSRGWIICSASLITVTDLGFWKSMSTASNTAPQAGLGPANLEVTGHLRWNLNNLPSWCVQSELAPSYRKTEEPNGQQSTAVLDKLGKQTDNAIHAVNLSFLVNKAFVLGYRNTRQVWRELFALGLKGEPAWLYHSLQLTYFRFC